MSGNEFGRERATVKCLEALKVLREAIGVERVPSESSPDRIRRVADFLAVLKSSEVSVKSEVFKQLSIRERNLVWEQERSRQRQAETSLLERQKQNGDIRPESHFAYEFYRGLVEEELRMMEGLAFERIMLVGCKPFPLTAMLYAERTGKPVTCYEPDAGSAALAAEALSRSKWRDRVEVVGADVRDADLRDYGLIVLDAAIPAKHAVLRSVRRTKCDSCYTICRVSEYFEPALFESLTNKTLAGLYPVKISPPAGPERIGLFLLGSRKSLIENLHFRWVDRLSDWDRANILAAMNTITLKDPGIGYPMPLNEEEGNRVLEDLSRNIETGKKHLLLVEMDGELAAQAILSPNQSINNRHLCEISRAFVMEPFRGIGLELLALRKIVARAKTLGVTTLILDTRGGTNAPKRWGSIGFKVFGVLPNYSFVRGKFYDGIYMYQTVEEFESKFGLCD